MARFSRRSASRSDDSVSAFGLGARYVREGGALQLELLLEFRVLHINDSSSNEYIRIVVGTGIHSNGAVLRHYR